MHLGKPFEPPAKKVRGRPRILSKGSTTDEKKRSRGRKIQNAFQKRRQAEVNQLQQRVATLESTIEVMSNEFLNFGDRVMRETMTPGVLDNIRQTTKRFLELTREVGNPEDEGGLIVGSSSRGSHMAHPDVIKNAWSEMPPLLTTPFDFNALFSTAIPNLNIPITGSISQLPTLGSFVSTTGGGRFSPRLDYGVVDHIWIPSPSTLWDNLWLSYLIAGPNSFASRLYIDSMDLVVRALRGEVIVPGFIPSALRYRFRHENPDSLMRSVLSQLERMSLGGHKVAETRDTDPEILVPGVFSPNSPNAVFAAGVIMPGPAGVQPLPEPGKDGPLLIFNPPDFVKINDVLENLLVHITEDILLEGGTLGDWLDPWSVQQYMDQEWGLRLNAEIARPTAKTLRVLRGYQIVHWEQEMDVGVHPVQPITDVQQEPPLPSWDFGDNFYPNFPVMPPGSIPPFPFYTDPLVAQRLAFVASVAPPAPPSYILATIPTFQPVPVSGSTNLKSSHAHLNTSQFSASISHPSQAYQTKVLPSQNLASTSGSGFSSNTHKSLRTGTRLLPSSVGLDNLISLPEALPATPLVTALALQLICFGEGPRYHRPIVNETVRNFLEAFIY